MSVVVTVPLGSRKNLPRMRRIHMEEIPKHDPRIFYLTRIKLPGIFYPTRIKLPGIFYPTRIKLPGIFYPTRIKLPRIQH